MKIDRSSNVLSTCHIRLHPECAVFDFKYELQPGSDTMDAIFALRALMELYREICKKPLTVCLVDVSAGLYDWKTCLKHIIRDMHRNSASVVRASDVKTYLFPIIVGVHQVSAYSPFLLDVLLDVVPSSIHDSMKRAAWSWSVEWTYGIKCHEISVLEPKAPECPRKW